MAKRTWKPLTRKQVDETYERLQSAIEGIYEFVDLIADAKTRDWVLDAASDLTDLMVDLYEEQKKGGA